MNSEIKDNPYALLALFLSPWKKPDDFSFLKTLIMEEAVQWEQLLFQANRNLCTPLLYVCLKKNRLLKFIPGELKLYLQALYEANLERNTLLLETLFELHEKFNENNIPFVLLKGGAALWDNLYEDPGARLLQDLDILVQPENAEYAWHILVKSGYEEILHQTRDIEGLPTDSRHHHLNTLRKSGTTVLIDIHYRSGYAKAGELLPSNEAWDNTVEILHSGVRLQILNPTYRLIHNTVHGLIPQAEFIQGMVLFQQLAEFAFIVKRYNSHILWKSWLAKGKENGLAIEFLTYLVLAQKLMGMIPPAGLITSRLSKLHAVHIAAAGKYYTNPELLAESWWQKRRITLMRFVLRSYYLLKLPAWVWQNVCYTEGGGNTLLRVKHLVKKAVSSRSRVKI